MTKGPNREIFEKIPRNGKPLYWLPFLFLLSIFLLSSNRVLDTDSWMHLSLGRLIYALKGFPGKEVFAYPASGMPFFYTSWLFGVASYLVYHIAGAPGLSLMTSLAVTTAFFILYRDSLQPYRNGFISVLALSVSAIASMPRFVPRPDIFLMTFLPFSIYCLNAYLYGNKKYVYALPFVCLLWANSHSSIVLMFVPFIAFIAGGFIQMRLNKMGILNSAPPTGPALRTVLIVFAASIGASLINPNFFDQYFYGSGLLQSGWFKKDILELLPPAETHRTLLYAADALLLLSFIANWRRLQVFHLLLVIPFMCLPFVAVRFIFLLAIVGGPVFARNISSFFAERGMAMQGKAMTGVASAWVVIYCTLFLAGPSPLGQGRSFGLGFDYAEVPEGAIRYMDKKGIYGRVLNSFDFGGYIIWESYPKRTVFIENRGRIPQELLAKSKEFRVSAAVLDELYRAYGFESILIRYPYTTLFVAEGGAHAGGGEVVYNSFFHPHWALVYWDDASMLFLRRNGPYDGIIKTDEYKNVIPDINPSEALKSVISGNNKDLITEEIKRNAEETGSSYAYTLLGVAYNSEGRHREAIDALSKVRPGALIGDFDLKYTAYTLTGDSYLKLGDRKRSLDNFRRALKIKKDAHYSLALFYMTTGDREKAVEHFREYLRARPTGYYSDLAKKQIKGLSR